MDQKFGLSISILPEDFKIQDIGKHVCVSHHGSVTEEAYYGGNPVITSAFGLTKNFPGFYSRWGNPQELSQLLSIDPCELNTIQTKVSRSNFYEYISCYRLSGLITVVEYGDLLKAIFKHMQIDLEYVEREPYVNAEKLSSYFTQSKDNNIFDEAVGIYKKEL